MVLEVYLIWIQKQGHRATRKFCPAMSGGHLSSISKDKDSNAAFPSIRWSFCTSVFSDINNSAQIQENYFLLPRWLWPATWSKRRSVSNGQLPIQCYRTTYYSRLLHRLLQGMASINERGQLHFAFPDQVVYMWNIRGTLQTLCSLRNYSISGMDNGTVKSS